MTDIHGLINRIDQEIAAEVGRQKTGWAELMQANRERGLRLQRYETEAKHIIELVKPRLEAFIERFKAVVKAEPMVRQHTRAVTLTFAATVVRTALVEVLVFLAFGMGKPCTAISDPSKKSVVTRPLRRVFQFDE